MVSQDHYTSEFKATVALEALARNKKNLEPLSDKYEVPVSLILIWATQLQRNAAHIYDTTTAPEDVVTETDEETMVDVEINNEELSEGFHYGVMHDDLDIKKLAFWSILGIVFIIVFTQLLKEMYDQSTQINQERTAANTTYQISAQKKQAEEDLSSFGVVDIQKGVYRIPIDTVINNMAADNK